MEHPGLLFYVKVVCSRKRIKHTNHKTRVASTYPPFMETLQTPHRKRNRNSKTKQMTYPRIKNQPVKTSMVRSEANQTTGDLQLFLGIFVEGGIYIREPVVASGGRRAGGINNQF